MKINYEKKQIEVVEDVKLNGHQIYLMVQQDRRENDESRSWDDPYAVVTVKLGDRTGQESIEVGESIILLQRLQLKDDWKVVPVGVTAELPAEAVLATETVQ